jgi:hypothetical protein
VIAMRLLAVLLLVLLSAVKGQAQTLPEDREIVQLKGDLYRVRVGEQHTVFLVTPSGIVLVDPISVEVARWLQEEFEQRFKPGVVRFVVHTNHHFERSEGALVFRATAARVGHRDFNSALSASRHDSSSAIPISDRVRARDRNKDGRVTSEEVHARVIDIDTPFDQQRVITHGGRTFVVAHAPSDSIPDNLIVSFTGERIAFASEAPPLADSPFKFGSWKPRAVRRWLTAASALEFDTLLLADGTAVPKATITRRLAFVNDLVSGVVEEYEAGRGPTDFREATLPQTYRSDASFQNWRSNMTDVYSNVTVIRGDITLGGLGHFDIAQGSSCGTFASCSTGGMVFASAGSLGIGVGRWAGVFEMSVTDEAFSSYSSQFLDEDFAVVQTRASVMARHSWPAGAFAFRLLGGMSRTIGDLRGINRVKQGFAPFAGRHPIASHDERWGYTGGIDLVLGRNFGLVIPLRFTVASETSETFRHHFDAQAGVTLTMRLFRSVQ